MAKYLNETGLAYFWGIVDTALGTKEPAINYSQDADEFLDGEGNFNKPQIGLDQMPVGFQCPWWLDTVPSAKYMFMEGQDLTGYTEAIAIFGSNLPDLRERVLVHKGTGVFANIKDIYGEKTHAMTSDENGPHNHTQDSHNHTQDSHNHTQYSHNHTQNSHLHSSGSYAVSGGAHWHKLYWPSNGKYISLSGSNGGGTARSGYSTGYSSVTVYDESLIAAANTADGWDSDHTHTFSGNSGSTTASNQSTTATNYAATAVNQAATATNQSSGSGTGHNNIQPSIVCRWIAKVSP